MQTTVAKYPDLGMPGQIATLASLHHGNRDSKTSEEASASIPFGVFVKRGTTDDGVKLITATSSALAGLVVFGQTYHRTSELDANGLRPGCTFDVATTGNYFVRVEDAVTPASEVHVRAIIGGVNGYGAAGAENAGAVRGTADSTDCIDISAFAKFVRSAAAGEIAEITIDFTNSHLQVAG